MVSVTVGSPALLQAPTWRWDLASQQMWSHLKVRGVFQATLEKKYCIISLQGEKSILTFFYVFISSLTKTPFARRMLTGLWTLMISWSFPSRSLRALTSWLPRMWVIMRNDFLRKTSWGYISEQLFVVNSFKPVNSRSGRSPLCGCLTRMFVFSVPAVHPQRCGCQKCPVNWPQSSQDLWLWSGSWHHERLKLRSKGQCKSLSWLSFLPLLAQRLLWLLIT